MADSFQAHPELCRRPDKSAYPTRRVAKRQAKRAAGRGIGQMTEYRCECGYWHLGHGDAAERTKVRDIRALASRSKNVIG